MAQLEWLTHVWVEKQVWNSLVIRMSETTTFLLCMCRLFVTNCHESWYHVGWYVLEMYKVCSCTKPSFAFFLDGPANVSAKLPLHVHSCSRRQARCGVTFLSSTLSGLLLQRAYTYSKGSQSLPLTSENFCNNYHELHIRSFLDKMWHDIEWHMTRMAPCLTEWTKGEGGIRNDQATAKSTLQARDGRVDSFCLEHISSEETYAKPYQAQCREARWRDDTTRVRLQPKLSRMLSSVPK